MKKLFLLFSLLMLLGGGGTAWAANVDKYWTSSPSLTGGSSETLGGVITVVYGNSETTWTASTSTRTDSKYTVKGTKVTSEDVTDNIPNTSGNLAYFKLTPTVNGTLTVKFYNGDDSKARGIKYADSSTKKAQNSTNAAAGSDGECEIPVTKDVDYYIYANSGSIEYYGFTFTPEIPSDDMVSTWDFTSITNDDLTDTNYWINRNTNAYFYNLDIAANTNTTLYYSEGKPVSTIQVGRNNNTMAGNECVRMQTGSGLRFNNTNCYIVIPTTQGKGYKITYRTNVDDNEVGFLTPEGGTYAGGDLTSKLATANSSEASVIVLAGGTSLKMTIYNTKTIISKVEEVDAMDLRPMGGQSNAQTQLAGGNDFNFTFIDGKKTGVMNSSNKSSFSVEVYKEGSEDHTKYLAVKSWTINSEGRLVITLTPKEAGTAKLLVKFAGDETHPAAMSEATFTINHRTRKIEAQGITDGMLTIDYANANIGTEQELDGLSGVLALKVVEVNGETTNLAKNAADPAQKDNNFGKNAYTSTNPDVAEVGGSNGKITIKNAGKTVITWKKNTSGYYEEATASFTLYVKGTGKPVIEWAEDLSGTVTLPYGNEAVHKAQLTSEYSSASVTMAYRSSDPSVATVDKNGKIVPVALGTCSIYAHSEGKGEYEASDEISYTLEVVKGEVVFKFSPEAGAVNVGCTLIPNIVIPSMMADGVEMITATIIEGKSYISLGEETDGKVILWKKEGNLKPYVRTNADGQITDIKPVITAIAIGTAKIKVNITSSAYGDGEAEYTVTVTDATTCNFNWKDGDAPVYNLYEGDYMMIPGFTGNANSNENFSYGPEQAYIYNRVYKNGDYTYTYNNRNYKYQEPVPDFSIVNGTGEAEVFWLVGQGGIYPDTLAVHGVKAGTVTLVASDPQLKSLKREATINILPRTSLTSADDTYRAAHSYPYTWDFTGLTADEVNAMASNNVYWNLMGNGSVANGDAYLNNDYADDDQDGQATDETYKYLTANGTTSETGYMTRFAGMQLNIGNSGSNLWAGKHHRVRIQGGNNARLIFVGGEHKLKLPIMKAKQTGIVRLYIKAAGTGNDSHIASYAGSTRIKNSNFNPNQSKTIYHDFDASKIADAIEIRVSNIDIYWIAITTEARNVNTDKSGNHYATYYYDQNLDFKRTKEVLGVSAYVATGVSKSGTTTTVSLADVTEQPIPARTGLVIKSNNEGEQYVFADAQNMDSYTMSTNFETNYLEGTLEGTTLSEESTDEDGNVTDEYVNYILARYYTTKNEQNAGKEQVFTNYGFYKVLGSASVPKNGAYLKVPKDLVGFGGAGSDYSDAAAKVISIVFEDFNSSSTTEVSNISDELVEKQNADGIYNLNGMRIAKPSKGIYIKNGKKYVIK